MKATSEKRLRAGISAAFAFLLLLCMLAVFVSIGAAGIFSEGHLRASLEHSNYVDQSYEKLLSVLREQAREHGIPQELLTGSIDRSTFEKALETSAAGGKAEERSQEIDSLEQQIRSSITTYFNENNIGENDRIEEAADEIAANGAGWYENYTAFPFAEILSEYKVSLFSWMRIVIPAGILLGGVLIFLLFRLHEQYRTGGCYVLSSLLAVALISGISGFVLRFGLHYEIPEAFPAYRDFAESFFQSPAIILWMNGFGLAFLSIIGIVILSNEKEKT